MAFLTAGGQDVTEGLIEVPKTGRAIADLRLATAAGDAPINIGDAVTLAFEDGTEYAMACVRAGDRNGLWAVRLVGGVGGLGKDVKAKFYGNDVAFGDVFKDALREVGETAGDVDLPGSLKFWSRHAGTAFEAIRALLIESPKRTWRVGRDGKVNVFIPAASAGPAVELVEAFPASNRYMLNVAPTLEPYQTIQFGEVDRVIHRIDGGKLRTEAWIA